MILIPLFFPLFNFQRNAQIKPKVLFVDSSRFSNEKFSLQGQLNN